MRSRGYSEIVAKSEKGQGDEFPYVFRANGPPFFNHTVPVTQAELFHPLLYKSASNCEDSIDSLDGFNSD